MRNNHPSGTREPIGNRLRARLKTERRKAILEYATVMAGTGFDLDPILESAAVEDLVKIAHLRLPCPLGNHWEQEIYVTKPQQ